MADKTYAEITRDGLWSNNPALVQILGMCPVLAVSTTMVNAIGMAAATMLALILTNGAISLIRDFVKPETRIPVFVMVIASIVTAIEMAMNAFFHELYTILGIFVALIVTNCIVLGRAEAFASKTSVGRAMLDGLTMSAGFGAALIFLATLRELIGHGTLFAHASTMFGDAASWLTVTVIEDYRGFLLAILPPGAFIGLGLLIAVKNIIDASVQRKAGVVTKTAELPGSAQGAH
ncbi:MAG: electron transport complex subunit E [Gammaproteobacteria bacterium]|nr:electron transport complex subunit E [Gammaproteobacteria bacterium]